MDIINILSRFVDPVAKVFKEREERKKVVQIAKKKIQKAQVDGDVALSISDAEWEALKALGENETFKDEYVTVVIMSPILGFLAGGVLLAFYDDDRLLSGVGAGVSALASAGVDMGSMMTAVVYAAVGLKIWRKF